MAYIIRGNENIIAEIETLIRQGERLIEMR
jgi:hypothetical protein